MSQGERSPYEAGITPMLMDVGPALENDLQALGGLVSGESVFFARVVVPMGVAFDLYKKEGPQAALDVMRRVQSEDWRKAGVEWLERRAKRRAVAMDSGVGYV